MCSSTGLGKGGPLSKILGRRGAPSSAVDAISKVNPHFGESAEYGTNCNRCVWAVEAQRRGYNVEALPNNGDESIQRFNKDDPRSFINAGTTTVELHSVPVWGNKPAASTTKNDILSHNPEGSRGMLIFTRANRSGHVVNWEISGGKLNLYDGQIGKTWTLSGLIKDQKAKYFFWGRMDNIEFGPLMKDLVKRR